MNEILKQSSEGSYIPADSSEYGDDVFYDKIVRDGIVEYLDSIGVDSVSEKSEDNEKIVKALIAKIHEESDEYLDASPEKKPGELADLLEIIYAIAKRESIDMSLVEDIRQDKLKKRGGYDKGIFLKRATKREIKE